MEYIFTPRGLEKLKQSISEIEETREKAAQEKIKGGSGQDTWHDEGFRVGATEESMWNKRLSELKNMVNNAKVIEPEEQDDQVEIGNGVLLEYEDGMKLNAIMEGSVFGEMKNVISISSPVGQAIKGARKEEEVPVQIGDRERVVKILDIFPPSVAEKRLFEEE